MTAAAGRFGRWSPRTSGVLVDIVLGSLVMTAVGVAVLTSQPPAGSSSWPAYAFAFGFGLALLWRRQHAVFVLLFTSVGICVYYSLDYPPIGLALPIVVAMFSVAESGRLRVGVGVAVALVALAVGFQVAAGRDPGRLLGYEVPPVVALMGAALALGDGSRTRRLLRVVQRDRERQARVELEHRAIEERAAERLSLARDLHDTLGYHLSVMMLQSAVAVEALPHRLTDVDRSVREVRRVGGEAMAELRDTVRRLRSLDAEPNPWAGLDRLPELAERARRSGLDVRLAWEADGVSTEIGHVAYLIVQEAVTNVIRHAGASRIEVDILACGDRLLLSVTDDGHDAPTRVSATARFEGGGIGILGMRERAENLGGWATVTGLGSRDGTRVRAELPLRPVPGRLQDPS